MNRLKTIRQQNNLTQDDLANTSGISIRTIQRIEKGLSTGSPHTIKNLARALSVEVSDLHLIENPHESASTINGPIKLMNLSILSCLLIPLGNLIFPTIIFLVTKKTNEKINTEGRKILSSQILVTIVLFLVMLLIGTFKGQGFGAIPLPVICGYWTVAVINLTLSIDSAVRIQKEQAILPKIPNLI